MDATQSFMHLSSFHLSFPVFPFRMSTAKKHKMDNDKREPASQRASESERERHVLICKQNALNAKVPESPTDLSPTHVSNNYDVWCLACANLSVSSVPVNWVPSTQFMLRTSASATVPSFGVSPFVSSAPAPLPRTGAFLGGAIPAFLGGPVAAPTFIGPSPGRVPAPSFGTLPFSLSASGVSSAATAAATFGGMHNFVYISATNQPPTSSSSASTLSTIPTVRDVGPYVRSLGSTLFNFVPSSYFEQAYEKLLRQEDDEIRDSALNGRRNLDIPFEFRPDAQVNIAASAANYSASEILEDDAILDEALEHVIITSNNYVSPSSTINLLQILACASVRVVLSVCCTVMEFFQLSPSITRVIENGRVKQLNLNIQDGLTKQPIRIVDMMNRTVESTLRKAVAPEHGIYAMFLGEFFWQSQSLQRIVATRRDSILVLGHFDDQLVAVRTAFHAPGNEVFRIECSRIQAVIEEVVSSPWLHISGSVALQTALPRSAYVVDGFYNLSVAPMRSLGHCYGQSRARVHAELIANYNSGYFTPCYDLPSLPPSSAEFVLSSVSDIAVLTCFPHVNRLVDAGGRTRHVIIPDWTARVLRDEMSGHLYGQEPQLATRCYARNNEYFQHCLHLVHNALGDNSLPACSVHSVFLSVDSWLCLADFVRRHQVQILRLHIPQLARIVRFAERRSLFERSVVGLFPLTCHVDVCDADAECSTLPWHTENDNMIRHTYPQLVHLQEQLRYTLADIFLMYSNSNAVSSVSPGQMLCDAAGGAAPATPDVAPLVRITFHEHGSADNHVYAKYAEYVRPAVLDALHEFTYETSSTHGDKDDSYDKLLSCLPHCGLLSNTLRRLLADVPHLLFDRVSRRLLVNMIEQTEASSVSRLIVDARALYEHDHPAWLDIARTLALRLDLPTLAIVIEHMHMQSQTRPSANADAGARAICVLAKHDDGGGEGGGGGDQARVLIPIPASVVQVSPTLHAMVHASNTNDSNEYATLDFSEKAIHAFVRIASPHATAVAGNNHALALALKLEVVMLVDFMCAIPHLWPFICTAILEILAEVAATTAHP